MTVELTTPQKKELQKILLVQPGFSCQGPVGRFLDSWLVCEVLAKKLIMYHKAHKELPITWKYTQLISALKYYSLRCLDREIKDIFRSGKGVRGKKTPRQIRNAYLHTLSEEDRKEIGSRINVLLTIMEKWKRGVVAQ